MNCAFHPINAAGARCWCCGRGLCPGCDHRIKGHPYCQDCIVAGVETLKRGAQPQTSQKHKSPGLALLLGLIPGLGAAYNGQNIKALLHFGVTIGLWEMADVFHTAFLGLAGGAFYLYSIYDAHQSAKRLCAGEDLRAEDEHIKQVLRDNTHIWGSMLVGIGVLAILNFFLRQLFSFSFPGLLPVLLVIAGFFLVRHYYRDYRAPESEPAGEWKHRVAPPSVIQQPYEGDYIHSETRRFSR